MSIVFAALAADGKAFEQQTARRIIMAKQLAELVTGRVSRIGLAIHETLDA